MKKMLKRLCTGFLALATVVTALPTTPVHAESRLILKSQKMEKSWTSGTIFYIFGEVFIAKYIDE